MARPLTAGPDAGPEPPFPIKLSGRVIKGFGRGSRELGIPTANIPITGLDIGGHTDIESGVYYGWAGLCRETATDDPSASPEALKQGAGSSIKATVGHAAGAVVDTLFGSSKDPYAETEHRRSADGRVVEVYPMVVSIGWNPYYKNEARSVEIHIIHKFDTDFYNSLLNISITGFIRKEQDYDSLQALIDDIKTDIEVGGRSLERKPYAALANDPFLLDFDWAKDAAKLS